MALPFIKTRRSSAESGFTLIEILVAGTLTMLLSVALFELFLQAQHMADVMITRVTLTGQAREMFELLADGGLTTDSERVDGFHGRKEVKESTYDLTNGRLSLNSGDASLQSPELSLSLTCEDIDLPILRCDAADEVLQIDGYFDYEDTNDFINNSRSVSSRTPEVSFTLIDAFKVPRANYKTRFIREEYSESFWTVFSLNVD